MTPPDAFIPVVVGGMLVVAGLIFLRLAARSAKGLLAPNGVAGIRTRLTMSSDTAWYAAQTAGAPYLRISGWISVLAGAAGAVGSGAALLQWFDSWAVYVALALCVLSCIAMVALSVKGLFVGERAARAAVDAAQQAA